jgi:hypothetical protein
MNKIFSFTLTAYFVVLSGGIQAMEFEIIDFYGREVLLASGPIERGDEIDYLIALKKHRFSRTVPEWSCSIVRAVLWMQP